MLLNVFFFFWLFVLSDLWTGYKANTEQKDSFIVATHSQHGVREQELKKLEVFYTRYG